MARVDSGLPEVDKAASVRAETRKEGRHAEDLIGIYEQERAQVSSDTSTTDVPKEWMSWLCLSADGCLDGFALVTVLVAAREGMGFLAWPAKVSHAASIFQMANNFLCRALQADAIDVRMLFQVVPHTWPR